MKISSRWIILAALLPVIVSAQTVFETKAGFVSATFARDASRSGLNLLASNCTAFAGGVLRTTGSLNNVIRPVSANPANAIAMALTNQQFVTVASFVRMDSINNSSKYATEVWFLSVGGANDGIALYITSNKVMARARSILADGGQEVITAGTYSFSNQWRHIAASYNFPHDYALLFVDGTLAASGGVTFSQTAFSPTVSATIPDQFLGNSSAVTSGRIGPVLIETRIWNAAEAVADFRRRGKDFLNP